MHTVPFLTLISPGAGVVQTVVVSSYSGVPIYAKLFAEGSDTVLETTGTGVESANDKGEFRLGLASGATGVHKLGTYRVSDNALLDRLVVNLAGPGQTSYAYNRTGDLTANSAAIAAAVDIRLSATHGAGPWQPDDTRLVMIDALVTTVISPTKVVLSQGVVYDDTMAHRTVLLFDASNGNALAGNAVLTWDDATNTLELAQTPSFPLAINDRVVVLVIRDAMYAPTGRWVNR